MTVQKGKCVGRNISGSILNIFIEIKRMTTKISVEMALVVSGCKQRN